MATILSFSGRRSVAASLAGFLFVAGCASPRLSIVPISSFESDGDSAVMSLERKHRVTVALLTPSFSRQLEELPAFAVEVENRGEEPLYLTPERVTVYTGEEIARAYTAEELAARINEEARREADEYTGRQAEVILQSDATRHDPSAGMANITAARRTNRAAADSLSWEKLRAELGALLAPSRIQPGEKAGGIVKLQAEDIRPGEPLRVVVSFGGESYEFDFETRRD